MANSNPSETREDVTLFVCWTTFDSPEKARIFGQELVNRGIAACVQLDSPIESIYQWKDECCISQEYRLWLKVLGSNLPEARKCLNKLHPYTTPQWIECRAEEVEEKYLKWAKDASNFHAFQNQEPE